MTFGSVFGRVLSPTFQPKSQAASGADTWWDLNGTITSCIAAYQPKGAASYAASKVNLANPGTYDAVDGAAYPTWAGETGWTFNGSSQRLNSEIVITSNMSVIVRFSNAVSSSKSILGASTSTSAWINIYPYYPNNTSYFRNGGSVNPASYYAQGVLAITPEKGYANGVSLGKLTGVWSGTSVKTILFGGQNVINDTDEYWAGKIQAAAIYKTILTDSQIVALTNAMNAL